MAKVQSIKRNNSTVHFVYLPKEDCEILGVVKGQEVTIEREGKSFVIRMED